MRLRYASSNGGYTEQSYWEDRHRRFKSGFATVAGGARQEFDRYPAQRDAFLKFLRGSDIDLTDKLCVEFGSGNGFWSDVVKSVGASAYRIRPVGPIWQGRRFC